MTSNIQDQLNAKANASALSSYALKDGSNAIGTWAITISGNAATATKLAASRTLWGQSFDGTKDISGDLTGVRNIVGGVAITIRSTNAIILKDANVGISLSQNVFSPQAASVGQIDLGAQDYKWRNLYLAGAANIGTSLSVGGAASIGGPLSVRGKANITGSLVLPYFGGMWKQMATQIGVIEGEQANGTNSAHALFRIKNNGGDMLAFGGYNEQIGFYGFTAETIAAETNAADFRTCWNVATGSLVHNKAMSVGTTLWVGSSFTSEGKAYLNDGLETTSIVLKNGTKTATISLDDNGDVHITAGVYSDDFISARGIGDGQPDVRRRLTLLGYPSLLQIRLGERGILHHPAPQARHDG